MSYLILIFIGMVLLFVCWTIVKTRNLYKMHGKPIRPLLFSQFVKDIRLGSGITNDKYRQTKVDGTHELFEMSWEVDQGKWYILIETINKKGLRRIVAYKHGFESSHHWLLNRYRAASWGYSKFILFGD